MLSASVPASAAASGSVDSPLIPAPAPLPAAATSALLPDSSRPAASLLRRLPIFCDLSDTTLSKITSSLRPVSVSSHFPHYPLLYRQGSPVDSIYFLSSGTVSLQYFDDAAGRLFRDPQTPTSRRNPGENDRKQRKLAAKEAREVKSSSEWLKQIREERKREIEMKKQAEMKKTVRPATARALSVVGSAQRRNSLPTSTMAPAPLKPTPMLYNVRTRVMQKLAAARLMRDQRKNASSGDSVNQSFSVETEEDRAFLEAAVANSRPEDEFSFYSNPANSNRIRTTASAAAQAQQAAKSTEITMKLADSETSDPLNATVNSSRPASARPAAHRARHSRTASLTLNPVPLLPSRVPSPIDIPLFTPYYSPPLSTDQLYPQYQFYRVFNPYSSISLRISLVSNSSSTRLFVCTRCRYPSEAEFSFLGKDPSELGTQAGSFHTLSAMGLKLHQKLVIVDQTTLNAQYHSLSLSGIPVTSAAPSLVGYFFLGVRVDSPAAEYSLQIDSALQSDATAPQIQSQSTVQVGITSSISIGATNRSYQLAELSGPCFFGVLEALLDCPRIHSVKLLHSNDPSGSPDSPDPVLYSIDSAHLFSILRSSGVFPRFFTHFYLQSLRWRQFVAQHRGHSRVESASASAAAAVTVSNFLLDWGLMAVESAAPVSRPSTAHRPVSATRFSHLPMPPQISFLASRPQTAAIMERRRDSLGSVLISPPSESSFSQPSTRPSTARAPTAGSPLSSTRGLEEKVSVEFPSSTVPIPNLSTLLRDFRLFDGDSSVGFNSTSNSPHIRPMSAAPQKHAPEIMEIRLDPDPSQDAETNSPQILDFHSAESRVDSISRPSTASARAALELLRVKTREKAEKKKAPRGKKSKSGKHKGLTVTNELLLNRPLSITSLLDSEHQLMSPVYTKSMKKLKNRVVGTSNGEKHDRADDIQGVPLHVVLDDQQEEKEPEPIKDTAEFNASSWFHVMEGNTSQEAFEHPALSSRSLVSRPSSQPLNQTAPSGPLEPVSEAPRPPYRVPARPTTAAPTRPTSSFAGPVSRPKFRHPFVSSASLDVSEFGPEMEIGSRSERIVAPSPRRPDTARTPNRTFHRLATRHVEEEKSESFSARPSEPESKILSFSWYGTATPLQLNSLMQSANAISSPRVRGPSFGPPRPQTAKREAAPKYFKPTPPLSSSEHDEQFHRGYFGH